MSPQQRDQRLGDDEVFQLYRDVTEAAPAPGAARAYVDAIRAVVPEHVTIGASVMLQPLQPGCEHNS